jgi:SAM-dependent methyltransferase
VTNPISHRRSDDADLAAAVARARRRVAVAGREFGSPRQLDSDLDAWADCELGKWMLCHGGWNAFWTRYCVDYPRRVAAGEPPPDNPVELFFLTRAPAIVATQQRSEILADVLAELVRDGDRIVSVPCGAMDDLLRLPRANCAETIMGVDLDPEALSLAAETAAERGLSGRTILALGDAWDLPAALPQRALVDEYRHELAAGLDLVTSNGLNIYVGEDDRVRALYKSFRSVLRPGGHLVVSALTPPSAWELTGLNHDDLIRARGLMLINDVMWSNLRPVEVTIAQLADAGLEVVEVRPDARRVFPTFVARAV